MPSHPKKFPLYLQNSFGAEEPLAELQDPRENYIFNTLFRVEQHMDQYYAYKYVEENWLNKDITTLTAADFITLAKDINRIAGRSLMAVKFQNGSAGEFLRYPITMSEPTGLQDVTFEGKLTFSHENYGILREVHGEKIANLYQDFCFMLELEYRPSNDLPEEKKLSEWAGIIAKHSGTPGAKAFALVQRVIHPDLASGQMELFSKLLVGYIAAKKDSITIAAFILSQLLKVHAFPHANSRGARIYMNTILMMLGHEPIHITADKVDAYYECQKQSRNGNIQPLKDLLAQCPGPATEFGLISNFFTRHMLFDVGAGLDCEEFKYNYILPPKSEDFYPLAEDINVNANFYLQRALRYVCTNYEVANFYFTAAKRLSNNEELNPELAARLNATIPAIDTGTGLLKKFKHLYMIAPNETARMSADRNKNEGLVAFLTGQRYAVVIMDKQFNVSMTILDRTSSLDFISKEVKAMKVAVGDFTIDIIKDFNSNTSTITAELSVVQKYIADKFQNKVKNSKGTLDIRTTKTNTVMIVAGKLQTPARIDVQMRVAFNVFSSKYFSTSNSTQNPLKDWVVYDGTKSFQVRLTERLLIIQTTPAKDDSPPSVVFDEEWTSNFPQSSAVIGKYLESVSGKTDEEILNELKKLLPHRSPQLLEELAIQTKMHNGYSSKCLYPMLHSFFNKPTTVMPQNVIGLISGYAESEELAGYRSMKAMAR